MGQWVWLARSVFSHDVTSELNGLEQAGFEIFTVQPDGVNTVLIVARTPKEKPAAVVKRLKVAKKVEEEIA